MGRHFGLQQDLLMDAEGATRLLVAPQLSVSREQAGSGLPGKGQLHGQCADATQGICPKHKGTP